MEWMKPYKSLVTPTSWYLSKVYSAIWSGSSAGLCPYCTLVLPHHHKPISNAQGICSPPLHKERPMLGTTLQNGGCCAEKRGVSQHSHFPSPADANYSLLNVNGGNISPTQKSSGNGPIVFTVTWEQKAIPPSKLFTFSSPIEFGKHREVCSQERWEGNCKSSQS